MKKLTSFILALALLLCLTPAAFAEAPAVDVPSYTLMERETGTVLCSQNEHEQLPPASVTKIMTLLLICQALDDGRLSLSDMITASTHASKMGGSQIYLREHEQMSCEDMLKSAVIASANDACVALAEHLCGSEDAFVAEMNSKAAELGMADTCFKNCTGLPEEGHVTSAHDIALMSRELLRHEVIRPYATTWMDSVRNGEFGLTNTNRLVRFFEGTTGLKTGFTSEAMYCMSATAERDGMELICVIMHAQTSDTRFEAAKSLLSYGFANYALVDVAPAEPLKAVPVVLGSESEVAVEPASGGKLLTEKALAQNLESELTLEESVEAPVQKGQKLGELRFCSGGEEIARVDVVAAADVEKLGWFDIYRRLLSELFAV